MTKQEAMELENICGKLMSYYLKEECAMAMALTGKLKINFDVGYITVNTKFSPAYVDYVSYAGYYEDLKDHINKVQQCLEENRGIFGKLLWSYEHVSELV